MTTEQEDQVQAEAIASSMLARDNFSRWMGAELVVIRPRACTLKMKVRADMLNGFGVSHGGIVFAFADSALAFASNTNGHVTVSVDNTISYPAPIELNDELIAVAEEESASARLAFYRVTVGKQDGTCVALMHATVYRTQQKHHIEPTHGH
jgi:acyl-CoA thioesterase